MMRKIKIAAGSIRAEAELNESATAEAVWEALPIQSRTNTWGDEIYFSIPIASKSSPDAREVVTAGEIGYWPPGGAFCIFFGPTPASRGNEIRAASAVNILGSVLGDPTVFRSVRSGETVTIQRAEMEK